jgi:hypothetical protein
MDPDAPSGVLPDDTADRDEGDHVWAEGPVDPWQASV